MAGIKLTDAGDGIRVLSIDNPKKKNALNNALCAEMALKVDELQRDKSAQVLVVTGEGGAFCAGADLPDVFGTMGDDVNDIRDHLGDVVYHSFLALRALKIPVISAVSGPAIGAGLNLALVADIVIAHPEADFAATFSRIGLHQGGGCTPMLVETLGKQRALKLLLEGGRLTGQQAYEWGMVAELSDDPLAAAMKLAKTTVGIDPRLVRNIKTAVQLADTSGFDAALQFETWAQAYTATQPGIQTMIEKLRR
ncbi:enoyl-CoA hydratase [Antricoccus suffuscus]|uniref:Enoyl-CoA hydratase n=1 Tax=Antricoccus suffuscus TaxID=1629062 RepID=A0A2T0ZZG4_9ACTN|nr:enoyl-CoA hydratase-related protein [Antricoccus suffuscus]PRZ41749.1 enoyl-CoA hydratase [Antricoccus suffuscus]